MKPRTLFILSLGIIFFPNSLDAQDSGRYSGRYSVVNLAEDTIVTPTGQMLLEQRYVLSQFPDDPDSPFSNITGQCFGSVVLPATDSERAIAAAGTCHMMDDKGSGYYQFWQWRDAGTPECPIRCGVYNDGNGYGKFAGLSGSGTWNLTALTPGPGVMGRSTGTFSWK